MPLAGFQLHVRPEGQLVGRSLRSVNSLVPGHKLIYIPTSVRPDQDKAEIVVVMVPSEPERELTVLPKSSARLPAEWDVPYRTSAVGLVFGPQGLDMRKVTSLVTRDRSLITQLAAYAEKTAQTEALIEALAAWERAGDSTESLDAALLGFSSRYGVAVPKLQRNSPADQQAMALMRALNPTLATYDPLAPEARQRMQQSGSLAASVAGLFFGTPVGLAAGGAAMFVNLRSMMFPGSDFRSALSQTAPMDGISLCARRETQKSRTRVAYLWGAHMVDSGPPRLALLKPAHLAARTRQAARLAPVEPAVWKLIDRALDWHLADPVAGSRLPVRVKALPEAQSIEVDLTASEFPAGAYRLEARWDWETFQVQGDFHVHQQALWSQVSITPESRDKLIEGASKVVLEVIGEDFQFVEKVELRKAGERSAGLPVEVLLPKGARAGPQHSVELTADLRGQTAGDYLLLFTLPAGETRQLPLRILPPHPTLEGLPFKLNQGEALQRVTLRGNGLGRITRLETDLAQAALESRPGGVQGVFQLREGAGAGDRADLLLHVEGLHTPIRITGAVEVIGPRAKIQAVQISLPGEPGIEVRSGELPAGGPLSISLRIQPVESPPAVFLECAETEMTLRAERLRTGETRPGASLRPAGNGLFFMTIDPGSVGQAGCTLHAVAETPTQGRSDVRALGKVVRLPRIESFTLTEESLGESVYAAIIRGADLETIEKTGWNAEQGLPVTGLPTPVPGDSQKQTLRIAIPWPAPAPRAPLYVWLRGESQGRATRARF